jgi:Flp pilus assembly protein TadD
VWRTARAKIRARQGDFEQAESLAREAVSLGEPTDFVTIRAGALSDLAHVLALAGRTEEALAAVDGAARLYERKGNLTALAQLGAAAEELGGAPSSA